MLAVSTFLSGIVGPRQLFGCLNSNLYFFNFKKEHESTPRDLLTLSQWRARIKNQFSIKSAEVINQSISGFQKNCDELIVVLINTGIQLRIQKSDGRVGGSNHL